MEKFVKYNPEEILAAARYLHENNLSTPRMAERSVQDWFDDILVCARRGVIRGVSYIGTSGYLLTFDHDGEFVYFDVHVSPYWTDEEFVLESFSVYVDCMGDDDA